MKTLFHNFKSLYEDTTLYENKEFWEHFLVVNREFATKINEVRQKFENSKIVWV